MGAEFLMSYDKAQRIMIYITSRNIAKICVYPWTAYFLLKNKTAVLIHSDLFKLIMQALEEGGFEPRTMDPEIKVGAIHPDDYNDQWEFTSITMSEIKIDQNKKIVRVLMPEIEGFIEIDIPVFQDFWLRWDKSELQPEY